MNVQKARQIASRVAKIAELSSVFQARYGIDYRLDDASPMEAWELYREIMATQAEIAQLLDNEALLKPYVRFGQWWERRDVINTALVNELANDTMLLLERAAYLTSLETTSDLSSLRVIQEGIAGFLHPSTRQTEVQH